MKGKRRGAPATAVAAMSVFLSLGVPAAASGLDEPGSFSLAARTSLPDSGPASGESPAFSLSGGGNEKHARASTVFLTPPRKRTGRAWIEFGAFMTYSIGSYWIRYKKGGFTEDWQFAGTFRAQFKRIFLFQGWSFDSNTFSVNWTHNLAGGIYYQFSRTNYLSWLQSWLMSCVGSTLWECCEWKEVISLNDQIFTGLGGFAMGEPWYQIGEFLSHQPSLAIRVLGFVNPLVKLNRWLDHKDPATKEYTQPAWHDFGLVAGVRRLAETGKETETSAYFAVQTQLLTLPGYGEPGEVRKTIKDVYFTELSLDYAVRNGHADETNFSTSVVTWGLFRQRIRENREGYSLTLGLGSSFQYFKKRPVDYFDSSRVPVDPADLGSGLKLNQPRNFTDKLAIIHIAGPVLDWTLFRRGLKLRAMAAAYFDFGMINSLALNAYSALHDTPPDDTIKGMKTTLLYYGYYYAFGGTFSGRTSLEWGDFRARVLASFGAWSSADFSDRFADQITNNAHVDDNRFRYLGGVGWKVPHMPVELFVNYEGLHRWGRLPGVTVRTLEKRTFAGLEFSF
jgi:hypothetical protein